MKVKYLVCTLALSLMIGACEREDKNGGGDPPADWFLAFELVDSNDVFLYDSISELPFDTSQSYFTDAAGNKQAFMINNGGRIRFSQDSTGVSFVAGKGHISFENLEGAMSQFTWLLYIDSTYPPDTLVVYNPRGGGAADSARLNRTIIHPIDTIRYNIPVIHLKYP